METYAPIVYFAYNRPIHTRRTLEALSKCRLADRSTLHIYLDGCNQGDSEKNKEGINEVKKIVAEKQWCKEVIIHISEENKGLFKSIVVGVTNAIEQYGKVIVLEDDVFVFPGFLSFMNEALEMYVNTPEVMHISAFSPPEFSVVPVKESTYFFGHTSCWGWATWKRAWDKFEPDPLVVKKKVSKKGNIKKLNLNGTIEMFWGLKAIADCKFQSWNTIWHSIVFLNNGLSLHPSKSLVSNIGHDGSGTNCLSDNDVGNNEFVTENLSLTRIPLIENKEIKDFHISRFSLKYKLIFTAKHYLRYIFWR